MTVCPTWPNKPFTLDLTFHAFLLYNVADKSRDVREYGGLSGAQEMVNACAVEVRQVFVQAHRGVLLWKGYTEGNVQYSNDDNLHPYVKCAK